MPIHIQSAVEEEVTKLIDGGHIEWLTEVGEKIFVSPVVITHKSDGTVDIKLDSVALNKQIVKKTMQFPLSAELLDPVSMKISENRTAKLHVSTIDLDYASGQKETSKHSVAAVVGGKATGQYWFLKGFYGLAKKSVIFQTKNQQGTQQPNTGLARRYNLILYNIRRSNPQKTKRTGIQRIGKKIETLSTLHRVVRVYSR